jgi:hypothetical protein
VNGFQNTTDGKRCHGDNRFGDCVGAGEEIGGGKDFINEAKAEGFCRVDYLSGKHHAEGATWTDKASEALGAAVAGDQAKLDFGETQASLIAGDPEGTSEGKFAAAAESDTVNSGDNGFAGVLEQRFDEREDMLAPLRDGEAGEGVGFGECANVGARCEGTITGAGKHDDAENGVYGKRGEGMLELVEHLGVEGVKDLRPVEGDGRNGTIEVALQRFESSK